MMDALPDPLRQMRRYLLAKVVPGQNGKSKKLPFYANGQPRRGRLDTEADLSKLVTFDEAYDEFLLGGYSTLGFALVEGDGIGVIDLDECLDQAGRLIRDHPGYELALEAERRGIFVELSQSGRGLHIIGPCSNAEAYSKDGVEAWGAKRFLALTGEAWANPGGWVSIDDLRSSLGVRTKPVGDRDGDEGPIITPKTIAELRAALEWLSSDDRDLWVRMGMALKTLGPKGKALWLEWSAKSDKFDAGDAERVWGSFEPEGTDYRAVFAEAQRKGWKNPRAKKREAEDEPTSPLAYRRYRPGSDLQPTEYVLDGFMAVGVSVIAGAWGAGKSINLIPLMASVAHLAPESWGFRPDLRRKIIWVTEAPEQAHDTLYSLSKAGGSADWQEFDEWFHIYSAERKEPRKLAREVEGLLEELTWTKENGFDVKPVLVLDTTSANIEIENENDNSLVGKAMAALKQSLRGLPVVLIGHTPKNLTRADVSDMTFRGAGAWEADAVATYYLVHDRDTDMRFMAICKRRFNPAYTEIDFDSEGGSVLVPTPWGEPQHKHYLHGVPSKSNGETRRAARQELIEERNEERKERTRTRKQEQVLATIRRFAAEGRLATKTALRDEVKGNKELFYGALDELFEAELVQIHQLKEWPEGTAKPGPLPEIILPVEVTLELFLSRLRKGDES